MKNVTRDKKGREIMEGDTLKVFHFVGARRKRHYMYKYVEKVVSSSCSFFQISHLNIEGGGYRMLMDGKQHEDIEIVQGYGADGVSFDQRPSI